jgi:hypothetical protein
MKPKSPIPFLLSAVSVFAVLVVLAVLDLLGVLPAEAQIPRANPRPYNTAQITHWLSNARFSRTVTVDGGGSGDFSNLPAALAYVASQKPNWTNPWVVIVYPGPGGSTNPNLAAPNYTAASLTIPDYTSVQGFAVSHNTPVAWTGTPVVQLTATSGALVTLGSGSTISNLQIFWFATPTGPVKVLRHTGTYPGVVTNVAIQAVAGSDAFPVDGVVEDAGALYLYGSSVVLDGNPSGSALVNNNNVTGLGLSVYGGRFAGSSGCTALAKNTSANSSLKIWDARLDPGCTNDLLRVGNGPIEIYGGMQYGPASGVITHGNVHTPFGAALPATCSVGSLFVRTNTPPAVCACVTTNSWKCGSLN